MEEKPILDYLPPTPRLSRRHRIASLTTVASATLLVPAAVTAVLDFVFGAVVPHHWLTGNEFNQFLVTAAVCNGAGILMSILAVVLGKHHPAALFIALHLLSLLLLPSLGYA